MRSREREVILGIMTDEQAMYELLAKFLVKEGYVVKRVLDDISNNEDLALIIYAPTRDISHSASWFKNLKNKKPSLLVVQCCNEDYFDDDDNVAVLTEHPLNLKQLGETVFKLIKRSGLEEVRQRVKR